MIQNSRIFQHFRQLFGINFQILKFELPKVSNFFSLPTCRPKIKTLCKCNWHSHTSIYIERTLISEIVPVPILFQVYFLHCYSICPHLLLFLSVPLSLLLSLDCNIFVSMGSTKTMTEIATTTKKKRFNKQKFNLINWNVCESSKQASER